MPKQFDSLYSEILRPDQLSQSDLENMYALMCQYYEGMDFNTFVADLNKKTDVIILRTKTDKNLCGFSTLKSEIRKSNGRSYQAIFSGDTIVQKEYWGQRSLQKQFTYYITRKKLSRPMMPLYWFLMSKGYKTYMLMANNFWVHYPRYESATPQNVQQIMNEYYSELYQGRYNAARGVIEFEGPTCHLKNNVTPISVTDLKNPKIAFFAKANPGWQNGDELACLAELTWLNPFFYLMKATRRTTIDRWLRRPLEGQPRPMSAKRESL